MKLALTILLIIIGIALSVVVLMQKGVEGNATDTFVGSVSSSYWEKNKKHSKEEITKKVTVVLGILFFVVAAVLSSKWVR